MEGQQLDVVVDEGGFVCVCVCVYAVLVLKIHLFIKSGRYVISEASFTHLIKLRHFRIP